MKSIKLCCLMLLTGVIISTVRAQNIEGINGRLDAMAGAGVPDDIGWVCFQPRNYVKYPDYFQSSIIVKPYWGSAESFGRIILLKSINEKVIVGLTANNSLAMWGNFYGRATEFLEASGDIGLDPPTYTSSSLPIIPHIGGAYKVTDNITIGALWFLELAKGKTELIYDNSGTKIDSLRERKLSNVGGSIDATINLGSIGFAPRFTFGVPKGYGKDRRTYPQDSVNGFDFGSEANLMLWFGSAAWYTAFKYPIVLGMWGKIEKYQLSKTPVLNSDPVNSLKVKSPLYKNHFFFGFLGTEIHLNDNFMYTPEYDFELAKFYTTGAEDNITEKDTVFRVFTHVIRQGFEGKVKGKRFLDELVGRAGLVYKLYDYRTTYLDSTGKELFISNPVVETFDKFYGKKGMKITAGFGLTKKRATLDISADLLTWKDAAGSIVTGPNAAMASITVDIAREARYKKSESSEPAENAVEPPPIE